MLREERGFTLVEVVIALIVLSLVTVAVVRIYNSNLLGIILSGNRTEAIYAVQEKLELEISKELKDRGEPGLNDFIEIEFQGSPALKIPGWTVTTQSEKVGSRDIQVTGTVFIPAEKASK